VPNPHGVLVVDFGAQYAQLIARRVREADIYSEIVPSSISAEQVSAKNPEAIILSGGPSSVYAENAPSVILQFLLSTFQFSESVMAFKQWQQHLVAL
jgi:GMP synthase (glutamine-hydrolysing)